MRSLYKWSSLEVYLNIAVLYVVWMYTNTSGRFHVQWTENLRNFFEYIGNIDIWLLCQLQCCIIVQLVSLRSGGGGGAVETGYHFPWKLQVRKSRLWCRCNTYFSLSRGSQTKKEVILTDQCQSDWSDMVARKLLSWVDDSYLFVRLYLCFSLYNWMPSKQVTDWSLKVDSLWYTNFFPCDIWRWGYC